jgi:hypothetical protein
MAFRVSGPRIAALLSVVFAQAVLLLAAAPPALARQCYQFQAVSALISQRAQLPPQFVLTLDLPALPSPTRESISGAPANDYDLTRVDGALATFEVRDPTNPEVWSVSSKTAGTFGIWVMQLNASQIAVNIHVSDGVMFSANPSGTESLELVMQGTPSQFPNLTFPSALGPLSAYDGPNHIAPPAFSSFTIHGQAAGGTAFVNGMSASCDAPPATAPRPASLPTVMPEPVLLPTPTVEPTGQIVSFEFSDIPFITEDYRDGSGPFGTIAGRIDIDFADPSNRATTTAVASVNLTSSTDPAGQMQGMAYIASGPYRSRDYLVNGFMVHVGLKSPSWDKPASDLDLWLATLPGPAIAQATECTVSANTRVCRTTANYLALPADNTPPTSDDAPPAAPVPDDNMEGN